MERAQSWLEENLDRPFNGGHLAAAVGVSAATLAERFVLVTGESPVRYLQGLRVMRAKKLLELSNASVDEVTQAVGYRDARTFIRLFRDRVGLAPRQFRLRFRSPRSAR